MGEADGESRLPPVILPGREALSIDSFENPLKFIPASGLARLSSIETGYLFAL